MAALDWWVGIDCKGALEILWIMMEIVCTFILVLITLSYICLTQLVVPLKWVNFILCKLYPSKIF
jgi:hypothetical protein